MWHRKFNFSSRSVHPFSPYRNENIIFHMNNDMFIMIWIVYILKIKSQYTGRTIFILGWVAL